MHWNTDAHNTFLSIMAHQGLIGIAAFVFLFTRLLRRPFSPLVRALRIALIGGVLYQGLTGSFESTRHVWALAGLLAAAHGLRRKETIARGPLVPA